MSEFFYGGDGVKERQEYRELMGEALHNEALSGTEALDELFELGYALETTTHVLSADRDAMEREMTISYPVFDKSADDVLYYNAARGGFYTTEGLSTSYEKDVTLRHSVYRTGVIQEEYFVSFERRLPYINGAFFHTYLFEYMIGGTARVTVTSNNIDVDDEVVGSVFERQVSTYDMGEFHKEVAEVVRHLQAGHHERVIQERLQSQES